MRTDTVTLIFFYQVGCLHEAQTWQKMTGNHSEDQGKAWSQSVNLFYICLFCEMHFENNIVSK